MPPARKNGKLIRAALPTTTVAIMGEIAAPTERATPVTPAAAERSSGLTTATVYDWRAGTSICEMENRSQSIAVANDRFGMSGTRISNKLEGTWLKTIVLTS